MRRVLINNNEPITGMKEACLENNLNVVRFFFERRHSHEYIIRCFTFAVCAKSLDVLNYFVEAYGTIIKTVCNVKEDDYMCFVANEAFNGIFSGKINSCFNIACHRDDVRTIKNILDIMGDRIQIDIDVGFTWACLDGSSNVVKYLYDNEIVEDKYVWNGMAIACRENRFDVIDCMCRYMRTIPAYLSIKHLSIDQCNMYRRFMKEHFEEIDYRTTLKFVMVRYNITSDLYTLIMSFLAY
jgi:hypothetical protein